MSQRNEIERKEKLSENKRKYFDQLKSMAVKREKDFNKVKSDEMLRALEKKKQQEYIKMVQYVEKHEKINSQKKAMDLLSKDKTEQQMNIINEKLKEMKDKKEFEQKLKIDNLLLKVQFLDERKKKTKK